ncbi:MAG: 5-formyltetrahydrofolate cyclo-ligase [Caldicoprobacterales bacterium]|nr:5-formyltetrahydrofolate cyclo-ligase [Clostridiales bacterium]
MDNIRERKKLIRKEMLALRNELTREEYLINNRNIRALFSTITYGYTPQNFMSYVNIGKEVNTRNIIECLLLDGKKVSVPICVTETTRLIASQIYDLAELAPSHFGLLEPIAEFVRQVDPKEIEVVLVPGLAFDRRGNRLGYGKGYYDRFLIKLSPRALKIGLAYSFQIIDEVPIDDFDIPLDIIVTEREIIVV